MKMISPLYTLAMAILFLLPLNGHASVIAIHDNFGAGDSFNARYSADIGRHDHHSGDVYYKVANLFTAPDSINPLNIHSIDIALSNPLNNRGNNLINVALHNDINGLPDTIVESYTLELDARYSSRVYSIESVLQTSLTPGSQYWLVASSIHPRSEFGWMYNGVEQWGVETGPVLSHFSYTDTWGDRSYLGQQAFRINATITPVPLPPSVLLLVTGIILLTSRVRASARRA